MDWDDLPALFPEFGGAGRWLPLLRAHDTLVEASRSEVRTTAVPAEARIQRHYAECLETLRIALTAGVQTTVIVDVGSGGGYPGIAWASVLPDARLHLVEPLQKRARFLERAAAELGLANVSVYAERAEAAGRGALRDAADIATARAVAALPELVEYVAPFARPGGAIVLPKGSNLDLELPAAAGALTALACTDARVLPMRAEINPLGRVLIVAKEGPTPPLYPRRAGLPGKRPISNRSRVYAGSYSRLAAPVILPLSLLTGPGGLLRRNPMDPNLVLNRVMRLARLDTTVFDEVRDDPNELLPAIIVTLISSLLAGIGSFLYWQVTVDFTPDNAFLNVLVLGTLFMALVYGVAALIVYVVLSQLSGIKVDLYSLIRCMGYASIPLSLSLFMFVPVIYPLFSLAPLGLLLVFMIYAVQSASNADSNHVVIASFAGFAVMCLVLGVIAISTSVPNAPAGVSQFTLFLDLY